MGRRHCALVQKLIRLSLGVYLAVTIVLTMVQMAASWYQARRDLIQELALLAHASKHSLETAVWNLDRPQIDALLEGLLSLPSIGGVVLEYAGRTRHLGNTGSTLRQTQALTLALTPPRHIGRLTVYARPGIVLERLYLPYAVLLGNALLKTVALWFILTWFGNRLIGRPLKALESRLTRLDISRIDDERQEIRHLTRKLQAEHGDDELGRMAEAFSEMSARLQESKHALDGLQRDLERQVKQRTRQLQQLNFLLRSKNRALEKMSTTDTLTGVANRMKLDRVLDDELFRSQRYGSLFAIILTDVDHFKRINDTYGHQSGDRVLQQLCRVIEKQLRRTDVLGRWGGEEFLVIARETDLKAAECLAQKLRRAVEDHDFGLDVPVTASFGVTIHHRDDDYVRLFERVDEALYQAKARGRNRVVARTRRQHPRASR